MMAERVEETNPAKTAWKTLARSGRTWAGDETHTAYGGFQTRWGWRENPPAKQVLGVSLRGDMVRTARTGSQHAGAGLPVVAPPS